MIDTRVAILGMKWFGGTADQIANWLERLDEAPNIVRPGEPWTADDVRAAMAKEEAR